MLAPDLIGHGSSPYEPPWSLDAHLDAIVAAVGPEPADWIGHSFGGRLAFELAARAAGARAATRPARPGDPPARARGALRRRERPRWNAAYVSFEEAVERRFDESQLHGAPRALVEEELRGHLLLDDDGRWRYRYCQAAVVAAYGEMASEPPPFEDARVPTLLVLGSQSYLPYDHLLDAHRAALGSLLTVVTVSGGHTVLWDALDETAEAITSFLGE